MSAIHVARSFAYGVKLCLYWVAVVLVGGGGVVLGSAIAWPEIQSWRSNGVVSMPELVGGAVLAVLGVIVLVSGLFGILYKLIADSVAEGRAVDSDSQPADDVAAASPGTDEQGTSTTTKESETTAVSETPESSQPGAATTRASDHGESDVPAETQIETVERRSVEAGSGQPGAQSPENQPAEAGSADDDSSWTGEWEEGTKAAADMQAQDEPPREEGDLSSPDPTPPESTPAPDNRGARSQEPAPDESVDSASRTQPQPSAEEIAFGSTGGMEEEPSTGEIDDEPSIDDPEDETTSTEEPEDEGTSTETAGSPSSDPLADRLGDDEN